MIPDFFIVGQAKSGTTALYEMLRRHPDIYMPPLKEPHFFSTELVASQHPSGDGLPTTLDDYRVLFAAATPSQRVGEASAFYLWSRTAAKGIAEVQPAARIIAILREPASYLRSLHLQFVQDHIESKKSLAKALALEPYRRAGRHIPRSPSSYWPQLLLYSEHLRYVDQLRRYHALFSPDRVLILIYDDFQQDNVHTVQQILRFLDVDDAYPLERTLANPTVRLRSQYFDRLVHAVSVGVGPLSRVAKFGVKSVTPQRARRRALQVTRSRVVYGNPGAPDTRLMAEIRHCCRPEIVALSEYLGRDLVTQWGYDHIH